MYKKLALLIVASSLFTLSVKPSESPKKYTFRLVQEAEAKFEDRIKRLEESFNKEGFLTLSVEDKRKLKFLLHQVIAYK